MQMVKENSNIRDITRGGQLYMHSFRMFGQVLKTTLMVSLILFVSIFIELTSKKTTEYERYILGQYIEAQIKAMFNEHAYNVIENPKGTQPRTVQINSTQFLKMPIALHYVDRCISGFLFAFKWALGISTTLFMLILWFLNHQGKKHRETTEIKGHNLVTPHELKKMLKRANKASDLTLAGVPLLKDSEVQHILFTGSTGTGKSVGMQELMDQVRAKRERAIVYDIEGSFISTYYRPGKDLILNPLDKRSPSWNHWQECRDAADYESIAASLMPLHLSTSDPFWINSARTIFATASLRLQMDNKMKNHYLLQPMFTENLGGLSSLVVNSVAETLVSEKTDKTALNIKSTLANYVKALTYLNTESEGFYLHLMSSDNIRLDDLEDIEERLPLMILNEQKKPVQLIIVNKEQKIQRLDKLPDDCPHQELDLFIKHCQTEGNGFVKIDSPLFKWLTSKASHFYVERPLFSIRNWIEADEGDGWLFIASNALKLEAFKPLISVWFDVAAKSVLSLTPSFNRRLWFFMDELASLHRLSSLMDTLSRSRKYGGCFIGAIQDIHQLRTIYGPEESKSLTGLFNTHLCYRTQGPDSAYWMSKIIGSKEIVEKKEGYSMGAHEMRDGVSIHQERRREAVVMDSEFLELEDLQAYLRLPGNWPVTKLQFEVKKRPQPQPPLISRELKDVLILENNLSNTELEKKDNVPLETDVLKENKKSIVIKKSQKLKQSIPKETELDA